MKDSPMITVRFIADFPPYGIKKGSTRDVSASVAHKLHDVYHVIADPEFSTSKTMLIRLVAKLPEYGTDWYPFTTHIVTGDIAEKLVSSGLAVMEPLNSEGYRPAFLDQHDVPEREGHLHSAFCAEHPDVEGIAAWLNSHDYPSDAVKISAISLAVQCSQSKAEQIFEEIRETGN